MEGRPQNGPDHTPMKVLLVNPNAIKPVVGPIAFDYLGQALEGRGFSVDVLDLAFAEGHEAALDAYFERGSPDAVGITVRNVDDCYFASQEFFIPRIKRVVDYLKTKTRAPLVLGGVGFSIMPERILEFCGVDFGIKGEGEYALPELLTRIREKRGPADVPGLVFRAGGEFRRNEERYGDLNRLPVPGRKTIDNPRYHREGGQGNIETKRGCDRKCIYCADPVSKGRTLRLKHPGRVIDELEVLLAQGVNDFHFCDSEFNLPPHHALAVCREIANRKLGEKIRWYTYASPAPFSDELARSMKNAGCLGIDFGVDSGDAGMLKRLGREFAPEDLKKTAEICRRWGIAFMYDLLLGGPGENRETLRATIDLMKSVNPSKVGLSLGMRIYPGTGIARIVRAEGDGKENANLHGCVEGNEDFFAPVFYVSSSIGEDISDCVARLVNRDERFFFAARENRKRNYNYNENLVLTEAIKKGARGAYWDILRKLDDPD